MLTSGSTSEPLRSSWRKPSQREAIFLSESLKNKTFPIRAEYVHKWTTEEETTLQKRHALLGPKWGEISACRGHHACRMHFRRLTNAEPDQKVSSSEKFTSKIKFPVKANAEKMRKNQLGDKSSRVKQKWTAEEDRILRQKYALFGNRWGQIAPFIQGRDYHGCRSRFHLLMKETKHASSAPTARKSRDDWIPDEDSILLDRHAIVGNRWCHIAESLPHRNGPACRKRFHLLNPAVEPLNRRRRTKWVKKTQKQRFTAEDLRLVRAHFPKRHPP